MRIARNVLIIANVTYHVSAWIHAVFISYNDPKFKLFDKLFARGTSHRNLQGQKDRSDSGLIACLLKKYVCENLIKKKKCLPLTLHCNNYKMSVLEKRK